MRTQSYLWLKSSYSGTQTNCVETALLPDRVGLRDSKAPHAARLSFPHREWVGFLREIDADRPE